LDTRTATEHFPGIGRYVVSLARAMAPLLAQDERLVLLRDPRQPSHWDLQPVVGQRVRTVDVPVSPFSLRQQWFIPRLLRGLDADLYHSPYYLMPYCSDIPTVLTVYDLIPLLFPQLVSARARLLFRWMTALALRAADCVIAISEATRRDLQTVYRLPCDKVVVIPLSADPAFYPRHPTEVRSVRGKHGLPEQYLLYLGSNKPHKNLTCLVEAFSVIGHHLPYFVLVVAGVWDSRYPEPHQRAAGLGLNESIRWLGSVPETDLPALYTGATAFVFPSLFEGFGLPVLEAMACGTPVACSETSSLPEVAGDAALLFDPTSTESIADVLLCLLDSSDLRAKLRARGLRRANQFSWTQTAHETLHRYRTVGQDCRP
jgi:alpha-1,3-rhamnosyl/mannosyltransferase